MQALADHHTTLFTSLADVYISCLHMCDILD